MHREYQQEAGLRTVRGQGRREWTHDTQDQHQMEAREHARQPIKAMKTRDIRDEEARRQIRDLRARY